MTTPLVPSTSTVREPVRLQDLTPEQHERLAAYRAMVARGIPADSAKKAVRQQFAPTSAPTGYGKAALRGVPRGAFGMLQSFANAAQANPSYAALDASLAMAGVPGAQPFAQTGEDLANRIAPPPTTTGPAMLEAGVAGGVGGVPFGPLGVASGVLCASAGHRDEPATADEAAIAAAPARITSLREYPGRRRMDICSLLCDIRTGPIAGFG